MKNGKAAKSLEELEDQNYYCAIDRLDNIHLPPFIVDPASNKLVPHARNGANKKKIKNNPVMFDRPIEPKVDTGVHGRNLSKSKSPISNTTGQVKI